MANNKQRFTVTRVTDDRFSVVLDVVLTDGTFRSDHDMRLIGDDLRSHETVGSFRVGGLLTVSLGPKSKAAVSALAVGDKVVL